MATAGITSTFTWIAAAVPTASSTHVNIWLPIIFAGVFGAVGFYLIFCCDSERGWLPGRRSLKQSAVSRMSGDLVGKMAEKEDSVDAPTQRSISDMADAMVRIAAALVRIAAALDRMSPVADPGEGGR